MNREPALLGLGIAIWVLYFLNLFVLAAMYPGYSHMRNWVSDLGRIEAPHHSVFNAVAVLLGALYLLTALGFSQSVKRITGRKTLSVVIGASVAAFGVNAFFGAFYPLPDPRHAGYGIGLLHVLTPVLLAWAFWGLSHWRLFTIYQSLSFALIVLITSIQMGAGALVNQMNLGLIQRLQALVLFTWFASTCYWLMRYKSERAA
jgi:hypothetical protein